MVGGAEGDPLRIRFGRLATRTQARVLGLDRCAMLLRMNSLVDIARLADAFSFVPLALLGRAAAFRLGEGLVAGQIAPHPVLTRGAQRWTREGGADVPTAWASSGEGRAT